MPAPDAELVAAVGKQVKSRDLRGENGGIVVRQHMHQRAELDPPRPLRAFRKECKRVRRGAKFREKEVLDYGVCRVTQAIGVHDLLERFRVNLLLWLAGPSLKLGIDGELHGHPPPPTTTLLPGPVRA